MKTSKILLIGLLLLLSLGMLATNYLFKQAYNEADKTDPFRSFKTLNTGPFKHLFIAGDFKGKIVLESGPKNIVKIDKWEIPAIQFIKMEVKEDTLQILFPDTFLNTVKNMYLDAYTMIRIQMPELESYTANGSNIFFKNMQQNNFKMKLTGNAHVTVNSKLVSIETVTLESCDSANCSFGSNQNQMLTLNTLNAQLKDRSLANMSGTKINQLNMQMDESSKVELSGFNFKQLTQGPVSKR